MADIVANDVRFNVQRLYPPGGPRADSPGVVAFVHGLLGNLSVFYFALANHVAAAGFDVILYDLRGHGLSECTPSGYTFDHMVGDLEALLDVLEPDRSVHLVGYSLGGPIAQGLTVHRPDRVTSLVLVEGLIRPESAAHGGSIREQKWMVSQENPGAKVAEYLIEKTGTMGTRWASRARRLLTQTTFHADITVFQSHDEDFFRAVQRPTLVLCGDESEFFTGACRTVDLIPDTTVEVLPGYDHDSIMVEGSPAVRARLIDWLMAQSSSGGKAQKGMLRCHASFS